ncbi:MFS transporter [Jeotgalicoccus huakuii]|nr:MFS transporter [Jeotgalicoccus huakuii]
MKNLYNRNTLILLFVIAAVSINLRLGITSIGPLMDTLKESLNLSSTQASLLTTVPVLCMGIFALLATVLNKTLGSKITLLLMLSILLISTLIRGFYTGFITLLISAFFVGLAIAVLAPTLSSVIKKYFPGHAAVAIGISSFFMSAGSATTAALTGAFYTSMDSYPFALAIWSVFSFLAIIVVLFTNLVPKTTHHPKLCLNLNIISRHLGYKKCLGYSCYSMPYKLPYIFLH